MATTFDYKAPYDPTAYTVPAAVQARWKNDLLAQRAYILAALQAKIPDVSAYDTKMAVPSSARYKDFLATTGSDFDRTAIVSKQAIKMALGGNAFLANIVTAFGTGNAFDVGVNGKAGKFNANALLTLAAVGYTPTEGWGPASKTIMLMNGDTRPLQYPIPGEVITGVPGNAFDPLFVRGPRAFVLRELVRGLVLGQYYVIAGDVSGLGTWQTAENAKLTAMMAAMKAPTGITSVALAINYNTDYPSKQGIHGTIVFT